METMKSRSESPYSKNKAKAHLPDTSENGNSVIEQVKRKKKNLRNKSKSQSNGKETEDLTNTGKDYSEEETATTTNELDNKFEPSTENGINNGEGIENGKEEEEILEVDENKENDVLMEDSVESNGKFIEIEIEECKSTASGIEEESKDQCGNTETESGAKKDNLVVSDSISQDVCESSVSYNGGTEEMTNGEAGLTQELDPIAESSEAKETSQISVNGSEGSSHYEEANGVEENIQASPDTATKDDNSISHKITNFLGKWNYSQQKNFEQNPEQKQDSEVSSSKRTEETISHPYLSKVSGRRGIRDRLNSSATVFSSRETEIKTPENSGKISLDDSFRVRTNPPRLQSSDLSENPTLRKFKGKRCLNAGDEPEEEDDAYLNTSKRRKLDEKAQESGLLGSILWSPFKKKTFDNEEQTKLATTESKLSRLLSPFWFWKRTAAGQKGK